MPALEVLRAGVSEVLRCRVPCWRGTGAPDGELESWRMNDSSELEKEIPRYG